MKELPNHIRHGFGAVRPCVYGHADLPDFLERVFHASVLERHEHDDRSAHIEMRIGDSVVAIEAAPSGDAQATVATVYVYVEDVDSAYRRAMAAGATSVSKPADRPYQERSGAVKDSFGNIWWISTYRP